MNDAEKSGKQGARNFLESAIEATKIRDKLESFGEEDLARVVRIARSLGYDFDDQELKAVLAETWSTDDMFYVRRFCLSEPPGF